ncbi:hypothetical protein KCU95_g25, partial [Aureobasidium melanogenum]
MANFTSRIASFLGDLSISREQDWKLDKSSKTELTSGNLRRRLSNTLVMNRCSSTFKYSRFGPFVLTMISKIPSSQSFRRRSLELSENLRNPSVNFRTDAFVRCEAQDEALATRAPPYGGSSNMPHTKVVGRDECKGATISRVVLSNTSVVAFTRDIGSVSGKLIDIFFEGKPADLICMQLLSVSLLLVKAIRNQVVVRTKFRVLAHRLVYTAYLFKRLLIESLRQYTCMQALKSLRTSVSIVACTNLKISARQYIHNAQQLRARLEGIILGLRRLSVARTRIVVGERGGHTIREPGIRRAEALAAPCEFGLSCPIECARYRDNSCEDIPHLNPVIRPGGWRSGSSVSSL